MTIRHPSGLPASTINLHLVHILLGGMRLGIRFWNVRFLIPAGIGDCSPGPRSDSDEYPGNLVNKGIRPRKRVAEGAEVRGTSGTSGTPFRVQIQEITKSGVVVAITPRPRACPGIAQRRRAAGCNPSSIMISGVSLRQSRKVLSVGGQVKRGGFQRDER